MVKTVEAANQVLEQIVVVRLGDQEFGLEIGQVREIIRLSAVTPMPNVPETVLGMINVRGKIIPVVDMHRYLGLAPTTAGLAARIVVIDIGGTSIGLQVDAATDVIRVARASLEAAGEIIPSGSLTNVIGVFNLDDRLITLLDTKDLAAVSSRINSSE